MVLGRGKRIRVGKKDKKNKGEEYQAGPRQPRQVADFKPNIESIETEIDQQDLDEPVEERTQPVTSNFIMDRIGEKKKLVGQEKKQINDLEQNILKHCAELEALQYIASGEPSMAIMDLLEMIQDMRKDIKISDTPQSMLDEMEKVIIESTVESFKTITG